MPGAVLAGPTAACGTVAGPWTVLDTPAALATPLTLVAAAGDRGEVLVVSDGTRVARSDDLGCTWQLLPLPEQPGRAVVDVAAVVRDGVDRVHVLTGDANAFAADVGRILTSEHGGAFSAALPGAFAMDSGRPSCSPYRGCHLVVSEADPDRVFLLAVPTLQPGQLWRSDDGAASFELVHTMGTDPTAADQLAEQGYLGGLLELGTDPADRDALVAILGCGRLARSGDGGDTWRVVDRPGEGRRPLVGLSSVVPHAGPQRLVAVEYSTYCSGDRITTVHTSTDGGGTWNSAAIEGNDLDRVAIDGSGQVAVVSDEDGALHRVGVDDALVERLAGPGDAAVTDVAGRGGVAGAFVAVTTGAVVLLDVPVDGADTDPVMAGLPPLPPLEPCPDPPLAPRAAAPSSLEAPERVEVPAGGRAEVDLVGVVGGRPVPVDVGVLLDTSGSMDPAAASLSRSIERAGRVLLEADVDAHVGLARFADLQALPYQRLLEVGPIDCAVRQRLDGLEFDGVTEPHLLALGQVVAGDGVPAVRVPAGEHLQFRDESLRLVVHVTDEPIERGLPHSPRLEEVGARFVAAGARQVGVQVLAPTEVDAGERVTPGDTRQDLAEVARVTGALAGRPIDCDGDGLADVATGEPVVCGFDPRLAVADGPLATELGSVLAQVVEGMVLDETARVVATDVPSGVEVSVAGSTDLDPRAGGRVRATLDIHCPEARAREGVVALVLVVGDRTLVEARTLVTCGAVAPVGRSAAAADAGEPAQPAPGSRAEAPAATAPPVSGAPPAPVPVGSGAGAGAAAGAGAGAGVGAGVGAGAAAGATAGAGAGATTSGATAAATGLPAPSGQSSVPGASGAVVVPGRDGAASPALVEAHDGGSADLVATRWRTDADGAGPLPAAAIAAAAAAVATRRRRSATPTSAAPVTTVGHHHPTEER